MSTTLGASRRGPSPLYWLAICVGLGTLAAPSAFAQRLQRDHGCETECHQKAAQHNRTCRGQRGCFVTRDRVASICESVCRPQAPPTDAELQAIAQAKAQDIMDMPVEVYETIDYLDANGTPRTRLFIFSTDALPQRSTLVRMVKSPQMQALIDTRVVCVEVGLKPDLPPIVGYWRGVPIEHSVEMEARSRLARDHNSRAPVLARRYGSAITPILEFEDRMGRIAVDGRNLRTQRNPTLRVATRRGTSSRERLKSRQAWSNQLRRVGR